MKLLVGIMHCIESEFDACRRRISEQTCGEVEQFVISGLPNKEAHLCLYRRFEKSSGQFDAFVKVDADMVIRSNRFFEHVLHCFSFWPEVTHLEFPVFDHFTMRSVYGLHAWRSSHRWAIDSSESVFVDRANGEEVKVRLGLETPPAADHCPAPSSFQAYHFGVHKAVKVMQPGVSFNEAQATAHWQNFCQLERSHALRNSLISALPILGFLDAVSQRWGPKQVDFACEETNRRCQERELEGLDKLNMRINQDYGLWARKDLPNRLRKFLVQSRRPGGGVGERLRMVQRLIKG